MGILTATSENGPLRLEPDPTRTVLTVENKCLKATGKCALKVMSFVTCLGSKCSYYNDLSSPLLIHEIIHGDSIDPLRPHPVANRERLPY